MRRYILTGAPGCGKTALLRELQLRGFAVVEEAATDVIALRQAEGISEPWTFPSFLEEVVDLQRQRQLAAKTYEHPQFFDRSPFCTLALARYLGFKPPPALRNEIRRVIEDRIYHVRVFFLESLGFVERTAARRITLDESERFAAIHLEVYKEFGFELFRIPAAPVALRADKVLRAVDLT